MSNELRGRLGEPIVWALATTFAMALASIAFVVIALTLAPMHLFESPIEGVILFVLGGLIAGGVVGGGQWLTLSHRVSWANLWFKSTVISWACAAVAWWAQYVFLSQPYFEIAWKDVTTGVLVAGTLSGMVIGGVQWLIMRRRISISPLWIVSTVASWFVAALVSAYVLTHFDFGLLSYLVPLLILGLIVGLGTGLAQLVLIGYPIAKAE